MEGNNLCTVRIRDILLQFGVNLVFNSLVPSVDEAMEDEAQKRESAKLLLT